MNTRDLSASVEEPPFGTYRYIRPDPEPVVNLVSMAPKPETQFIRACSTGKSEVVRELLQGGISTETRDTYGLTGLIWAGRKGQVGVAEVLLAGGADVEAKDRTGRTALQGENGGIRSGIASSGGACSI